jgi:class 3 adenylate cyclase/tetratricopeptide (TPR) repeat protein
VDVGAWLRALGFGHYVAAFAENRIDAELLRQLTGDDLKELGVAALGDRKKLLAAIAELNRGARAPPDAVAWSASPPKVKAPLAYTPHHLVERILESRSEVEGERKHVTVLFADIKGSTALIEGLDPEEAARRLGPAIAAMMDEVHRYEGTCNKVQGDGIMALFGAPLAHEDHALRACLSALAIRDSLNASENDPIELRIGLHSGEVLVRAIHNDLSMDYDAIGAAVHLASRMEQMATPGCVFITAATKSLAEGLVETRSLGSRPVKGITNPVEVFELLRRTAHMTRWKARSRLQLTAFVGRSAERGALLSAADRVNSGGGQVVAIIGEAGIGKSRLVHELLQLPQISGWSILQAAASSYGTRDPLRPVTGLLRTVFSIGDRDSKREIEAKISRGLGDLPAGIESLVSIVRFLLNLPVDDPAWNRLDPELRRTRVVDGLRQFILTYAEPRPLLILIEDLHWIDSETQLLLDALADSIAGHRVLLLVTYRPEYQHRWANKSYYEPLRLNPLTAEATQEMVNALVGSNARLGPLKKALVSQTEGRPLFIEEVVRSMKEAGVLVERGGVLTVEGDFEGIDVPASVRDVLASRIDRLDPALKRLLQAASVVGRRVSVQLLGRMTGLTLPELTRRLMDLQEVELLHEVRGGIDAEFQFKHALTEEVAYASLTYERRRELHGRLVDEIEWTYADRLDERYDELGRHALRAERWDKASFYCRLAAKNAHERSAYTAAIEWFHEALAAVEKLPDDSARRRLQIEVRLEMRTALWPLGRHEELVQRVTEAGEFAKESGDKKLLANVYNYLTAHYWQAGEHDKAIRLGEEGIALAEAAGDFSARVTTMQHLGLPLMAVGRFEQQIAIHREVAGLLVGEKTLHHHGMSGYPAAITRGFLAWGLAETGRFDEALKWAHEGVAISHQVDSAMSQVWVTDYLALTHVLCDEPETACALMHPNLELCKNAEVRLLFPLTAGILGLALAGCGRADEAISLFEQALDPERLRHHPEGSGYPLVWHALVLSAAGMTQAALDQLDRANEIATAQGERSHRAWALFARGEVMRAGGAQSALPEASYREALAIAETCAMQTLLRKCHNRLGTCT